MGTTEPRPVEIQSTPVANVIHKKLKVWWGNLLNGGVLVLQ